MRRILERDMVSVVLAAAVCLGGAGPVGAATVTRTFTNDTPIYFNRVSYSGTSYDTTPYPSTVHVPAQPGVIDDISVTLHRVHSQAPGIMNIKLVAPWATYYKGAVSLWSNAGGTYLCNQRNITFNDGATSKLPYNATINSGTYLPSTYYGQVKLPHPCPDLHYYESFADAGILDLMFPVGNWTLWCYDDYGSPAYRAYVYQGWTITLTMRYNGIEFQGGNDVRACNETPAGDPGATECLFATTTGGIFSSDYSQLTAEDAQQMIDDGTAPFDSLPALGTEGVQYWYVYHDGQMTGDATLTFTYDPAGLLPGVTEADLGVHHYYDGAWHFLGGVIDPDAHTVTVTVDGFSPFMLGVVPEPGTMVLMGLGLGSLLLRRRRR